MVSAVGPGAIYGAQQKNGLELAVDTINRAGGVNGAKISLDVQEDGSKQQNGVDAFNTEIGPKKALGIIGPTLVNTAVAADPVANKARIPVIAPSLTGAGVVGSCPYACDYILRDSLGEAIAIPENVKAARDLHHTRAAVILLAGDDRASLEDAVRFQQAFADNGISVPAASVISFGKADTDFAGPVAAAAARKADTWVISVPVGQVAGVIAEVHRQAFGGVLLGGDSFNNHAVAAGVGDAGRGAQSASGYFAGLDTPVNRAFVDAYSSRFKDSDGKALQPDELAAQAYAAVQLFAAAASSAHLGFTDLAADRTRLRDALVGIAVDTPMGHVVLTAGHDVRQDVYVVALDGKGGYTLVRTVPPQ